MILDPENQDANGYRIIFGEPPSAPPEIPTLAEWCGPLPVCNDDGLAPDGLMLLRGSWLGAIVRDMRAHNEMVAIADDRERLVDEARD